MNSKVNYVDGINDQLITLCVDDKSIRRKLEEIGGKSSLLIRKDIRIRVKSEQHKIELLQKLIDLGLCFFGGGHDWSPADIVILYREKGLLIGRIKQLVWTGPASHKIKEV
ncbi:MAG TPA: hypothetical protein PK036_07825 [Geobacteraceae bacterium]|nr:hypothetical protein [Geobacteraceae bacterium]